MKRRRAWILLASLCVLPTWASAQGLAQRCAPAVTPLDYTLALHRTLRDEFRDKNEAVGQSACNVSGWTRAAAEALISQRGGVSDGRGNGAAPAAVGGTIHARVGATYRWQWLTVRFAPELMSAANYGFPTFPAGDSARSGLSSPWYIGNYSADLPSRQGTDPITQLSLGESGIWAAGEQWMVGATTALPDWGPGIGEGLVLGRTAAGLPRLEASWRTAVPHGELELRWFNGAAVESRFFDFDPDNDLRGIAGARLSFARPLWRVGVSRTVMDGRTTRAPLAAAFLPLTRVGSDSVIEMLAADLRIVQPRSGTLVWMELARQAPLKSFREFALLPAEGLAMRVGVSQVLSANDSRKWILGFEAQRLEMPPQRADREDQDLYTSPTVIHGWTHRGEPLGSGIGPGGQRQMFSVDRETETAGIGFYLERVRWNDDALFRQDLPYPQRHDVTLQGGLRLAWQGLSVQWRASATAGQRLSYLFQNAEWIPGYRSDNPGVFELTLSLAPLTGSPTAAR